MSTVTCPHCQHAVDASQLYCTHCFLKLPGALRQGTPQQAPRRAASPSPAPRRSAPKIAPAKAAPAPPPTPAPLPRASTAPRLAGKSPAPRPQPQRVPRMSGECPACGHGITSTDEWCRWCKWPVNRKG